MPMVHRESVMPAFIVNLLCIAVHPERVQKIMENQPPDFPSGD